MERNPPSWLQASQHPAEQDRLLLGALVPQEGVVTSADLLVTQNTTPNMSVNVAAGSAFVKNDLAVWGGTYHVVNDATKNLVIAASNPTNPRNDLVVARVRDAAYSGGTNAWDIAVLTGTPAASPVDPSIPTDGSYLTLARVRVPAAGTTIIDTLITDLRPRAAVPANVATPIGAILPYAGTVAPAGWLVCDGTTVSRTTYAALFAVIGTTFGAGDGATTFAVPDLRSRVMVGAGQGSGLSSRALGANGGAETHTLALAEAPSHGHTVNDHTHGGTTNDQDRSHGHSTDSQGQHSHQTSRSDNNPVIVGVTSSVGLIGAGRNLDATSDVSHGTRTSDDGGHGHNISGANSGHLHGFATGGASNRGTDAQGSGAAHNNMQPWLALNSIIRAL